MSWSFHPYPLGEAAAAELARPIRVTLANKANRQGAFDTRRNVLSQLAKPVVVGDPTPGARGPGVRLAESPASRNQQNRRQAKSKLRPPVVVTVAGQAFRGPKITLVRIRPRPTDASVFPPAVIAPAQAPFGGVGIWLAPQRRGTPKSKLRPPAILVAGRVFFGPKVTLVRIRPRRTVAKLLRVPPAFRPITFKVKVTLAPSPRQARKATYDLAGPQVLNPNDTYPQGPMVVLAPQRRGQPKSKLRPPAVVTPVATAVFFGPKVTLTRIRPRHTVARLLPVPAAFRPIGFKIRTTLVKIRPPAVHSKLRPPVVVFTAVELSGPKITLTPSKRGRPKSRLSPPAVVAPVLAPPIAVTLVRIRPVPLHWKLSPPTVVAPVLARPILTKLVRIRPVPTRWLLSPPTVVFPFIARPIDTTLVRIRPVPTRYFLAPPTDLVDRDDLGYVRVHLAPSFRGKPKSRLSPPTVVFTAVELSGPKITLARIRPPKTIYFLRPQVAGAATPKAEYDIKVTLAPQKRGKPIYKLRPPTVVRAATPYFRREPVTLAPQRRGTPKSFLRPPIVVRRFVAPPLSVNLTYSRRGAPKSRLRPPVVVAPVLARPIATAFAPQRRGVPKSHLPQVLIPVFYARPTKTTLVKIRPPRVHSILRPPAVVGAGIAFFGPRVTLVRIRPPKTIYFLHPPTVEVTECYGDVMCGFDFAAEVCGSDEAATVIGSDETDVSTSGSDSAATVGGASAASGSVTGDDARREGC